MPSGRTADLAGNLVLATIRELVARCVEDLLRHLAVHAHVDAVLARYPLRADKLFVGGVRRALEHLRHRRPQSYGGLAIPPASLTLRAHAGPAKASLRAMSLTVQTLDRQAQLLAYIDVFRYLAVVSILCVPVVFILKKTAAKSGTAA